MSWNPAPPAPRGQPSMLGYADERAEPWRLATRIVLILAACWSAAQCASAAGSASIWLRRLFSARMSPPILATFVWPALEIFPGAIVLIGAMAALKAPRAALRVLIIVGESVSIGMVVVTFATRLIQLAALPSSRSLWPPGMDNLFLYTATMLEQLVVPVFMLVVLQRPGARDSFHAG